MAGEMAGEKVDNNYKKSADYAYEIICEQILSGDLCPGQRLSLRKMSRLTGASNIPVMQALHRLESEGLVQTIPYVGSRVIEFTEEVIKDRYALRLAVECQVARILCHRMTDQLYEELLAAARDIDGVDIATAAADRQFWRRHAEFHMSLARATGYKSLVDSLYGISLFNLVRRAESSAYTQNVPLPPDNHQRLINAIHSGDPDKAEVAARVHIGRSEIVRFDDL
jgi:DNA-binding GntR family transcriptional regulator